MVVKRMQARVSGRVQGVGYRYFAVHVAQQLGVHGSVRNMPNGDVEVTAEGDEITLSEFVSELREGPSTASVSEVQIAWGDPEGSVRGFIAVA